MRIDVLPLEFTVCKLADFSEVDPDRPFTFTGRTDDERSLVCPAEDAPANALERVDGWIALRVSGQLDFSLVGVISEISSALADAGIPVFVISTFDTDYVLVRREHLDGAVRTLSDIGMDVTASGRIERSQPADQRHRTGYLGSPRTGGHDR